MADKELSKKAKAYLSQIRKIDRLVKRMRETAQGLRAGSNNATTQLKPGMPRVNHTAGGMEDALTNVISLEESIDQRANQLIELKREAFETISRIPDIDQVEVLMARYIQLKPWDKIAKELICSERTVYTIHGRALISFAKLKSLQ